MNMLRKRLIVLPLLYVIIFQVNILKAQEKSTFNFEEALEIAEQNSPDIQQARFSLERSQQNLNAQEASLKSYFSLSLEPFYYSKQNQFNTGLSIWTQSETKRYSGTLSVRQPLIWTDAVISLNNQFRWTDSKSQIPFGGLLIGNSEAYFSNNLYISYDQPIFTYNRTKMGLEEVELDLENASLNYQLRELQLEQTVAQSFYGAYQNKMSLQVAKEEYQNRQESYNIIKNKVDAGIAAQEELYQAQLDLTTSQSQVQNQQVTLENSLDELKRLLGLNITDERYYVRRESRI